MASLYVDRPLMTLIRDEVGRLKQEAAKERDDIDRPEQIHVPEKEAVKSLLSENATRRLERLNGDH